MAGSNLFDWVPFKIVRKSPIITDDIRTPEQLQKRIDDEEDMFDASFFASLNVKGEKDYTLSKVLEKLRESTHNRGKRFREYELAAKDSVIGQAIEMMADDATQFDVERERTVWIESSDKDYEKKVNRIIHKYIEPFIDTIAHGILEKGEFAFKVNDGDIDPVQVDGVKPKEKGDDKDAIVLIPFRKIEKLHHLVCVDQSHWFCVTKDIKTATGTGDKDEQFKEDTEYLHFLNNSLTNSDEIEVDIKRGENGESKKEPVFVLQGEAIISDKVLETYRIVYALENAIIASRLAKSKMVRFINVEVGKVDNEKSKNIVNYIDGLINKNENIDKTADSYTASRIQVEPVSVVIPIKGDKGKVTVEEFNTSADIKDIADLDHFMNKLFAGLRTPAVYLGFGDALPGTGGSGSLMRLDIRYARAVRKVQRCIINGIKELVRIYNEKTGVSDNPPDCKVRIIQTNSPEDEERYFELGERAQTADILMAQIISADTGEINPMKIELLQKFFTEVVPINSMALYLRDLQKKISLKSMPPGLKTNPIPVKEDKTPMPVAGKVGPDKDYIGATKKDK